MNVLEKIVLDKRAEVAEREVSFPLTDFVNELTPSDRDFKQSLIDDRVNKGAAFILECKKASPSKGLIRATFDLDEICAAYANYASCVSVLTDEKYFQGEFSRIPLIKAKLPQPILCKDFFIEPYQVYLARYYGANAILLMLSVLDDETYKALDNVAKELGLAVLTEVSNEQEMQRAVELGCDILGINNRNLRDLSTDLAQTPALVAMFKSLATQEQQKNTILISESGIYSHDQVNKLNDYVQGYLVGSSLMAQPDLNKACSELVYGQHKVCGLTSSKDAINVANAGASFGGLIFVEQSKRYVTPVTAAGIIEDTHKYAALKFVAVVKNNTVAQLVELVKQVPVFALQLHGEEDQSFIDELRRALHDAGKTIEIWQVIPISETGELPTHWPNSDRILFDTITKDGTSGGSGVSFDWRNLQNIKLELPPIMLAGGINPDNVAQTLSLPIVGVDLNSGVEISPGVKDKELVEQCFKTLFQTY